MTRSVFVFQWHRLLVMALVGATAMEAFAAGKDESPRKGTLSGVVLDPDGVPVVGARIAINKPEWNSNALKVSRKTLADAMTDGAGRFHLGPLEAVYRAQYNDLLVEADGFAPQYVPSSTYSIFPDSDFDLGKISVFKGRVFSGQVLDADGKPRAGAPVKCQVSREVSRNTVTDICPARTVITDADGRFRTPPLPVGHAMLTVQEPQRQLEYREIPIQPGGEEALTEPIQLQHDVPIRGIIKDEDGRPIDGAVLVAMTRTATSDAQGNFMLRGFGPNPHFSLHIAKDGYALINWHVFVSDEGFRWHPEVIQYHEFVAPVKDFTIVMKRSTWIEGQALDVETGEPVRLDKVILCTFTRKPNGEILRAGCKNSNFEQPETGRFRVSYSRPDEYTLTFSAAGYQDAETFTPPVKQLQPIDGIVVKLKRNKEGDKPDIQKQSFAGRVTRDGKPVKTGWVGLWALRPPKKTVSTQLLRGRTVVGDPIFYSSVPIQEGTYSLDVPFQRGDLYVVVEEPSQAITQVGPFQIAANEAKNLDIACTDGGSISGQVENVPEAWKGQLWVVAFSKTAVRAETRVEADGRFSFKQLPPGSYGLKVGHDAYQDSEVPRPKDRRDIPKDVWKTAADPWKRAVIVEVEVGRDSADVQLELPQ
jgi:hypothetical protein